MAQLEPGIYTFYTGNENGRISLYCLYFDGKTMGSPVVCSQQWALNLKGSPCVFYDHAGTYAGDAQPRIHIFVLNDDDTIWWLSTLDGSSFIVHNENLPNVPTVDRFSALQLADGIHLYYRDRSTNRIGHAWSETDWTIQMTELLFDETDTAAGGVAAVQGFVPYVLFGSAEPDQPQSALQLIYFKPGTGSNLGNGQFARNSPDQQLRIQVDGAPAAALLGSNIFVPHKGMGGGSEQAYYATMSLNGTWTDPQRLPDAVTTNSLGCCVYGGRLFCFFQSQSDNSMWVQVYIGGSWLPKAVRIAGNTPAVYWGPACVAVERGGPPH